MESTESETPKETKEIMSVYTKNTPADRKDIQRGAEVVSFFTKPLFLMLLWNWLVPGLFGLATIGYVKAFGLYLISRILFNHEPIKIDYD
tara:strand:- start:823 stop:1092 length:270 start_codon:yes stop_codon:yes gene_type:complete